LLLALRIILDQYNIKSLKEILVNMIFWKKVLCG